MMPVHARRLGNEGLDEELVALGGRSAGSKPRRFVSNPMLAALRGTGTKHIYADTADSAEIDALTTSPDGATYQEIDGSTCNQPLLRKVVERYLKDGTAAAYAKRLRAVEPDLTTEEVVALVYAIINGRIGNDVVGSLASGRPWDISLQLHMDLPLRPDSAKRIGRVLRSMVPSTVVKVPFLPYAPQCLLVARDLENEGIPVNLTSTFSARQTVVAAMFANVTLTNIFMGRLNQGLSSALLGEHVDLSAQRWLTQLRRTAGIKTLLIVASVRQWQTFARVAGCDCFTAPCDTLNDLMTQEEIAPEELTSQLDTSYENQLGIADDVVATLGSKAIARTYTVEPELVQFLSEFRATREFAALKDGDEVAGYFERAGFGDLFYTPTATEWQEMRQSKLPDCASALTKRLSIDTLFTLLADADFEKSQEEINELIRQSLA